MQQKDLVIVKRGAEIDIKNLFNKFLVIPFLMKIRARSIYRKKLVPKRVECIPRKSLQVQKIGQ